MNSDERFDLALVGCALLFLLAQFCSRDPGVRSVVVRCGSTVYQSFTVAAGSQVISVCGTNELCYVGFWGPIGPSWSSGVVIVTNRLN